MARPQVDFGTVIWSAWGNRLLSEFGYGTIATAVGPWDTRRLMFIDNSPAGHNTVVIREAYASRSSDSGTTNLPADEEINFSQMNKVSGTMLSLIHI